MGNRRGRWGLLCGVDSEGEGPEPVVMGPLGLVEQDLPRPPELVPLHVELVEELRVEVGVEEGSEAHQRPILILAATGGC